MRGLFAVSGCLLVLAGCQKPAGSTASAGPAPAPAGSGSAAAELPERQPGLWTQVMASEKFSQVLDLCVDEASDARTSVWGQRQAQTGCSKNVVVAVPGGVRFESECDRGAEGRVVSSGTALGDFVTHYAVEFTTTTTGAADPKSNGAHKTMLRTAYRGPCPPGMKGGDIRVDGVVMAQDKMAAARK